MRPALRELGRWIALALAAYLLVRPYATGSLVGGGDAKFYSEAMQDYLGQLRAGIFPVWVSQTEAAPYGSIFPFHMASYHFYLGAALNQLTGGQHSVYAVQHLTLILSALGGIFAMYFALRKLAPGREGTCAALAFLYLSSPAWLAAVYGKDMYFTFMALPWLPVLFYAVVQTFRRRCTFDFVLMGAAAALVCEAHSPVGLWAAGAAAASQVLRLIRSGPPALADLGRLALAGATGLLLTSGLLASVWASRLAGSPPNAAPVILSVLRRVTPDVFLPVEPEGDGLADFQLGYALQLVLLLGLAHAVRVRSRQSAALIAVCACLLVLVYPMPGVTAALWQHLPTLVTTVTNIWPMQRIDPVLAALVPFAGLAGLASLGTRKRGALLALLCAWSAGQAWVFVRRGYHITQTAEATRLATRLENSPFQSAWMGYNPRLPDLPIIDRVQDPRIFEWLLDRRSGKEVASNLAAATGVDRSPPVLAEAEPLAPGVVRILPAPVIDPGRRYLLTLSFPGPPPAGILQILTLDPEPPLLQQIELSSATPMRLRICLWTSGPTRIPLTLLFRPAATALAATPRHEFAAYRLNAYDDGALPIRVTSLAPYTAEVDAGGESYLETHRIYASGYRAKVNGISAPVLESPRHLAMIPIGAGHSQIRLDYVGPPWVLAAYWANALLWIPAAAVLARFRQ